MLLPEPEQNILDRRDEIVGALKSLLPKGCVIDDRTTMKAFDSDGLSAYRNLPLVVVLPETTQQVADVMKWCRDNGVKIVPRGAGTSLSGGALPLSDGVLLGLGKFNQITEIDFENRNRYSAAGGNKLSDYHGRSG